MILLDRMSLLHHRGPLDLQLIIFPRRDLLDLTILLHHRGLLELLILSLRPDPLLLLFQGDHRHGGMGPAGEDRAGESLGCGVGATRRIYHTT